jgi:hypothetical protein
VAFIKETQKKGYKQLPLNLLDNSGKEGLNALIVH